MKQSWVGGLPMTTRISTDDLCAKPREMSGFAFNLCGSELLAEFAQPFRKFL
jgi:hypothetical protein